MPEQVILDFVGDPSGLKPVADALTAIGQLTEQQQKDFAKANDDFKRRMLENAKAVDTTSTALGKMSNGVKEIGKTLGGAAIKDGTDKITKFGNEITKSANKTQSLKSQLKELKAELAKDDLSAEKFRELSIEAAKIEDKLGDVNEEVRRLASDTRGIDLVVEGARGIAAGFAVAQAATALFGKENEDVQKALLKVQAAMTLLNGVQEISTILTTKGGIAQTIYAAAVGTATGAMKAFRIALLGTGIGALVFVLYEAAKAFGVFNDAVDENSDATKTNTKDIQDNTDAINERQRSIDEYVESIVHRGEQNYQKQKEIDEKLLQLKDNLMFAELLLDNERSEENKAALQKNYNTVVGQIKVLNDEKKRLYEEDARAAREAAAKANEPTEMLEQIAEGAKQALEIEERKRQEDLAAEEEYRQFKKELIQEETAAEMASAQEVDDYERELREERRKEIQEETAEELRLEQEKADQRRQIISAAFQAISMIVNEAFAQQQQQIQDTLNAQLDALNTQMEVTLANESLTASEREQIQKQFAEKEAQAKRAAWIADQNAKAEQALINGLLAFTTSLATQGVPAGLITGAIGLALAGVEAALIKSKPVPQFGEGGLIEGNAHSHGGVNINAEGGEYVFSKKAVKGIGITNLEKMNEYASMVPSIPADMLNQFEQNRTSTIDYGRLGKEFAKELGKNPMLSVSIDRNGVNLLIKKGNRSVNYLNNKFRN